MNIEQLLRDHAIPHMTEGHKHCTEGWVNVNCPFCPGSQDFHLGISTGAPATHCWRCGKHPITQALSRLLNLPVPEVKKVMERYGGAKGVYKRTTEPKVSIHPFKWPRPYSNLNNQGKKYLANRKFDPERLEKEWGLLQTGPVSFLDEISYSHRILIPIYWNGEIVSFQGRDITDKSDRKYLACPMKREKIHHKTIVYGRQDRWKDTLIVVEGVTDVWRLGKQAVATFGIEFKMEQVLCLKEASNRFFIIFDDEPQAQAQARELSIKLKALGKQVYIETIKGDPGGMKQDDANHLIKHLLRKERP